MAGITQFLFGDRKSWLQRVAENHQVYRVGLGNLGVTFVFDPNLFNDVMAQDGEGFEGSTARQRLGSAFPRFSVFAADKSRHAVLRHANAKAFQSANKALCKSFRSSLPERIASRGTASMSEVVDGWLSRLVCRLAIGRVDEALMELASRNFQSLANLSLPGLMSPALSKLAPFRKQQQTNQRNSKKLTNAISEILEEVSYTSESSLRTFAELESEGKISREEVIHSIAFFISAAYRGLRSVLDSVATCLANHTEWQNKLRETSRTDRGPRELSRACVKEALRMYPMVPLVMRQATKRMTIGDHVLEAGELVAAAPVTWQLDDRYFDNPKEFQPDRFLHRSVPKGHLLAFGGGKHRCIGSGWTVNTIAYVIVELLSVAEFSVADQEIGKCQWRGILMQLPKNAYQLKAREDAA